MMKIRHLLLLLLIPALWTAAQAQTIFGEDFDTQLFLKYNTSTSKWDSTKLYEYFIHDKTTVTNKWKYGVLEKEYKNGAFVPKTKSRYNFTVQLPSFFAFDSLSSYNWDVNTSSYPTWVRVEYVNDLNGKVKESTTYMKNPMFPGQPNEFVYAIFKHHFDGNGKLKGAITSSYDFATSKLQRSDSSLYVVDANNNITVKTDLSFKNGAWEYVKRTTTTYSVTNKILTEIEEDYNNNAWLNQEKVVNTYNGNDQGIEKEIFYWDGSAWKQQSKTVSTHSATHKTSQIVSDWNTGTNSYQNKNRTTYYFSVTDQRDSTLEETWNTSNNSWAKSGKYIFGYGGGPVLTAPAAPTNLTVVPMKVGQAGKMQLSWTDNANNELGFAIQRSTDNVNFVNVDSTAANVTTFMDMNLANSTTYYYRVYAFNAQGSSANSNVANATTTTSISEADALAGKISMYPNPASQQFTIESTELNGNDQIEYTVFDIAGKQVLNSKINSNSKNVISLEQISSGMYFVKLKVGNTQITKKLTVN